MTGPASPTQPAGSGAKGAHSLYMHGITTNGAFLGRTAAACFLYVLSTFLGIHFLNTELDPIRTPMSAYALGPHGVWVNLCPFAMSVAALSLSAGLGFALPPTRGKTAAQLLFLLAAAGAAAAGIFPMDFPGPARTVSGRLHAAAGALTFPSLVAGVLFFTHAFRSEPYWRRIAGMTSILSGALVTVLVVAVISLATLGFAGYAQRVLFALLGTWVILVGIHLARLPRS